VNAVVSGPKFTLIFCLKREQIAVNKLIVRFEISLSVPEKFALKSEVLQNVAKFSIFWPHNFFWGRPPIFWTGIVKLNMLPTM